MRHMSSQESPEVLTNFLPMIPYLDISAIQLLCRDKEVASLGASRVRFRVRVRVKVGVTFVVAPRGFVTESNFWSGQPASD